MFPRIIRLAWVAESFRAPLLATAEPRDNVDSEFDDGGLAAPSTMAHAAVGGSAVTHLAAIQTEDPVPHSAGRTASTNGILSTQFNFKRSLLPGPIDGTTFSVFCTLIGVLRAVSESLGRRYLNCDVFERGGRSQDTIRRRPSTSYPSLSGSSVFSDAPATYRSILRPT
ncbi:hypothetical protein B0H21DRAFT_409632 [Amylocystis lapponica]|nr:hypothetical protein B0H21DRAFT_409632 [Amylocystis lapponica]